MATINGTSGDDNLVGTGDSDSIFGLEGDDIINPLTVLAGGVDFVDGGAGIDTLVIDASAETRPVQLISGLSPTFEIRSNSGHFNVNAYNMEKIQFTGGSANDSLDTGNHGGAIDGGAGVNFWRADLSAVVSNIGFALGTTTAIGAAGLTSIQNIQQIDLTTGSGNDSVTGGALGDRIVTGAGNDIVNAGTRSPFSGAIDFVDGGAGVDTLVVDASAETQAVQLISGGSPTFEVRSESGNFYVDAYNMERVNFTGGSNDDFLQGGAANDVLRGGGGADTFAYSGAFGLDAISDFTAGSDAGHDVLSFNHTLFADATAVLAHATQSGTSTIMIAPAFRRARSPFRVPSGSSRCSRTSNIVIASKSPGTSSSSANT